MVDFIEFLFKGVEGAFVYVPITFYAFLALGNTNVDPKSIKYYALFLLYSAGVYIIVAGLMLVIQLI